MAGGGITRPSIENMHSADFAAEIMQGSKAGALELPK
jgi:hypothetical protein